MSARFRLSDMDKRVHAELAALADPDGFVAISIKKLALRLALNEIVTGITLNTLMKCNALAIARASYKNKPKTYRVIGEKDMLARQEANVIPFVPRQPKDPRPTGTAVSKRFPGGQTDSDVGGQTDSGIGG